MRRDSMNRRDADARMRKDAHERGTQHRTDPDTEGSDTAKEMRGRRDERDEIMEGYRGQRTAGQEGTRGESEPTKKPWWKFWNRS